MSIEPAQNLLITNSIEFLFKGGFVLFAVIYFIFSLIVIRQVNLMAETVKTEGAPILKALVVLFAGLSLGIIVIFIGFL